MAARVSATDPQRDPWGPERRLLAAVTSPVRDRDAIDEAARSCRDWDTLFRCARANGVLHQMALVLKTELDPVPVPQERREALTHLARQALLLDRLNLDVLAELIDAFGRAGLPLMLLKGQSLAERFYRNPGERLSADIDVLVQDELREGAERLLRSIGYDAYRKDYYGERHFHVPWVRRRGQRATVVELHWNVTRADSPVTFDVKRWWREARPAALRSGVVLLPPPAEELGYLCHHAFLEGAMTLRHLGDIARMALAEDRGLDVGEARRRAEGCGTVHFVAAALRLSGELWDAGLPRLEGFAAPGPIRRHLARNLVDPRTVITVGHESWWPFKRVCYWALLDPGAASGRDLLRRTLGGTRFTEADEARPGPLSRAARLASLAVALGLCLLPARVFRARLRQERRPRPPADP